MDFKRMKKRGMDQRVNRAWFDATRTYRITWQRQYAGIAVPPRFYACVKCGKVWTFAAHRRPYKTFAAAVDACEKNERIWKAVIELGQSPGRRLDRLRGLQERAKIGGNSMLWLVPDWVALDSSLARMMYPEARAKVEDDDEI